MVTQRHDPAVERMASLTFALLGAAQQRRRNPYRTGEWIQANVPGYPQDGDGKDGNGAFRKQLQRDVATLAMAGVPVVYHKGSGTEPTKVMIDEESYRLPEVEFTPAEAMILGLAGGLGQESGLSVFSQTGWTKIAAAGSSRKNTHTPTIKTFNDIHKIKPQDFQAIVSAIDGNRSITFNYLPTPVAAPVKRSMDPWGLVPRQGRVYLVGWDLDKTAPRAFRITRLSTVKKSKDGTSFTTPDRPLAEIVAEYIDPLDRVDAVISVPKGKAVELSSMGEVREDGLVEIKGVSADWLARTAAGFAPEVEVIEPQAVRQHIAELLKGAGKNGS